MERSKCFAFCAIHQDTLQNPVTLFCQHNYCFECIIPLITLSKIKCPLCQKITNLPNGRNSLVINHQISEMVLHIEQLSLQSRSFQDKMNHEKLKVVELIKKTFVNKDEAIEIVEINDIRNSEVKKKFKEFQETLKKLPGTNCDILTKFHGTYEKNIEEIKKDGFKLPQSFERKNQDSEGELTFGKAIYLSSYSSKATSYGDGYLIVCDIILGRIKVQSQSLINIDTSYALKNCFDSIFYDENIQQEKTILDGTQSDKYALYHEAQTYPKFAVKYKIAGIDQNNFTIEYTGNHNYENTDFTYLIKVLNGPIKSQQIAFGIIGDLCRDYNGKTVQNILTYYKIFFSICQQGLQQSNEQLVLHILRVFWNSSYQNEFMQKLICDNVPTNLIITLFQHKHQSIHERTCGVIQNLTSQCVFNAQSFYQAGLISIILDFIQQIDEQCHVTKRILALVGVLGNVIATQKLMKKNEIQIIQLKLAPLLDYDDENVQREVIRVISNQIGIGKEWTENNYKEKIGLEKI